MNNRKLMIAGAAAALASPALILPSREIIKPPGLVAPHRESLPSTVNASQFGLGFIASKALTEGSAPAFVAAGAIATANPAMPAGWAAGDFLMLVSSAYGQNVGYPTPVVTPAGWNILTECQMQYTPNTTFKARSRIYYRFAQAGDTAPTLTADPAGVVVTGSRIIAYRGVDATPFEAISQLNDQAAGGSNVHPYLQITTLGANRTVLQFSNFWSGAGTSTPGSGWTERFDDATDLPCAMDEKIFASAGLTSAGNVTKDSNAAWSIVAFALRPVYS